MAHLKGFDAFYARSYRRVVGQVFALLGDLWAIASPPSLSEPRWPVLTRTG